MYFLVLIPSSCNGVEIIGTASDILATYKLIQKQTGAYFRDLHEYSEKLYTDFGDYSTGEFSGKHGLYELFKTYPELKKQYNDYETKISGIYPNYLCTCPYGDTEMKELEMKHAVMKKQKPIYYDQFEYEYIGSYVLSKVQEIKLISGYHFRKIDPMCKALISIFKSPNDNLPIGEVKQFIDNVIIILSDIKW